MLGHLDAGKMLSLQDRLFLRPLPQSHLYDIIGALCFILFIIFVSLRMDKVIRWNWHLVAIPLYILLAVRVPVDARNNDVELRHSILCISRYACEEQ